jgi:imidazolonepropionase-like amidohydrolase
MTAILFENARLFDGVSEDTPDGVYVLVEGNVIAEVSDRPIQVPAAERIDCSGQTLMPGLIDNHIHIYIDSARLEWNPPITYRVHYAHKFLSHILSCGFTSVRDVAGGDHGMAMALRDGLLEGPRFFYGGLCLSQTGGHGDFRPQSQGSDLCDCRAHTNFLAVMADGVDECVKAVREELRKGAHHIKIMASGGVLSETDPLERSQYSEAEIRAIVEECTRAGRYACAHCHPAEAIRRCVEYGVRSIEHGTLIDEDTARFVAERGAYVVPTVATIMALQQDVDQLDLSAASRAKLEHVSRRALDSLEILRSAGVKIGFGTDLFGPHHTRQGDEFSQRARVLPPIDILRSATSVNAEILQMQDRLGVVKAGAFADLLLVRGNPLEDIGLLAANGSQLSVILKDGRFIKRCA